MEGPNVGRLALTCLLCLLALAAPARTATLVAAQSVGGSFSVKPVPDDDVEHPRNPARAQTPSIRSWFTFQTAPGAQIRDRLQVANTGGVPLDLHLYSVDATTGVTTGMVMENRASSQRGVGTWVALSTDSIHLAPGEVQIVEFTVDVPAGATPGEHWGGLIAEDTNVRKGTGQFAVDQVLRVGVALGVVLPGARVEQLAIRGLSQKVINNLNQVFVVDLANDGNVMVKPAARSSCGTAPVPR